MPRLLTVVELSSFVRNSTGELSEQDKDELKVYLAAHPESGVVIPGAGGVRKLRWAASGRGKRGGGRVIYYFHNDPMPVYLFNFFVKAVKADLTAAEKQRLASIVRAIVAQHKLQE